MANITKDVIMRNKKFYCHLRKWIVLLFVFSVLSLYSQTKPHIITGYVIDSVNQMPIENAHIISMESRIGLVSDKDGFFKMIVPKETITLKISFLGYYSKRLSLSISHDTTILVSLVSRIFELGEVAIKDENNIYNPKQKKYSVLDYDFMGDSLLVLQKRRSLGGTPSLVLLNWNFDTIAVNTNLPKGAHQIFKDCLNSHHIITNDSAYQIAFDQEGVILYQPYGLLEFYRIMEHCLFRKDGNIFFESSIYQGYGQEIIYINEKDKTRNLFVRYVDNETYSNMVGDISYISSLFFLHSVVKASTNDRLTKSHINNFEREERYIREIANQAIKNHICLFRDTVFYFNYYESKIQAFPKIDMSPLEVDIDNRNTKGWGPDIQIDLVEDKMYSIIKTKAYYQIYLVNPNTGTLEFITKLSVFKGRGLKINNGFLYYLSHAGTTAGQVKKLSRVRL